MGSATKLIHTAEGEARHAAPLTTPIYETTTFIFDSAADVRRYAEGKSEKYLYSRYANPTVAPVEAKIAELEGAETALVFGSGMAATTTTLLSLLSAGDELICSAAVYGGTFHLAHDLLPKWGITTRFVSLDEIRAPARLASDRTRVLWFESPINPTLGCVPIREVADGCRRAGILSIIDNTFASPINQQPIALGVDLVMHSATKYLNGHSDVTGGAIAGRRDLVQRVERGRRLFGTVLDPYPAYALGRGLKTLPLRMARHNANALAVAQSLDRDPRVRRVYYPGLPSHPDHAIAAAQMSGFGGMICVDLDGGYDRAAAVFDRLQVIKRAASLGGVESLCSMPVLTSHWGHSDEDLARAGVTQGMLRFSIGLEDAEDLIADLNQALE